MDIRKRQADAILPYFTVEWLILPLGILGLGIQFLARRLDISTESF
jgi:hypothetical protein